RRWRACRRTPVPWTGAGARCGGWGRGQEFRAAGLPTLSPGPSPGGRGEQEPSHDPRAPKDAVARGVTSRSLADAGRRLARGDAPVRARAPALIPGAAQAAHGCAAVANAVRAVSLLARGDVPD